MPSKAAKVNSPSVVGVTGPPQVVVQSPVRQWPEASPVQPVRPHMRPPQELPTTSEVLAPGASSRPHGVGGGAGGDGPDGLRGVVGDDDAALPAGRGLLRRRCRSRRRGGLGGGGGPVAGRRRGGGRRLSVRAGSCPVRGPGSWSGLPVRRSRRAGRLPVRPGWSRRPAVTPARRPTRRRPPPRAPPRSAARPGGPGAACVSLRASCPRRPDRRPRDNKNAGPRAVHLAVTAALL